MRLNKKSPYTKAQIEDARKTLIEYRQQFHIVQERLVRECGLKIHAPHISAFENHSKVPSSAFIEYVFNTLKPALEQRAQPHL